MVISGPTAVEVDTEGRPLSEHVRLRSRASWTRDEDVSTADVGCAAAVAPDGYFLTAAHCLDAGPAHLAAEVHGEILCVPARVVWSDGEHDAALIHADVRPESWFELAPERAYAAGEVVLAFAHFGGAAAGELEVDADLPALGVYTAVLIPHDTPLRRGHSGAPAATLDGRLLGVQTSTGMDTILRRRSWLVHVAPPEVRRLLDDDREVRRLLDEDRERARGR